MKTPTDNRNSFGVGKRRVRREGAVLGMVLVVMVMLSILGTGMLSLRSAGSYEAAKDVVAAQAFWLAEAGLEHVHGIANMNREPFEDLGLLGEGVVRGGGGGGGRYVVDKEDDPDTEIMGRYVITSTGVAPNGDRHVLRQRARIQTFANYIHASHHERRWNQRIYFGPRDVIDGEVYSNDEINIYGSPRLLQMVRSAARSVNYYPGSGAGPHVFEGGLTLGAPELDFEGVYSQDHVDRIRDRAAAGGLVLNGNYDLRFQRNGTVVARRGWRRRTYDLGTLNGAIYVNGSATVRGIVDGNVTVATERSIGIPDGGIRYESASGSNPSPYHNTFDPARVNDTMGLVARNSVLLLGRRTTPIHAAILTTGEGWGFSCARWRQFLGGPEIRLYGSLSQFRRGVVGTTSGRGFDKNYKYDTRLLATPPPHYPFSAYTYSDWSRIE